MEKKGQRRQVRAKVLRWGVFRISDVKCGFSTDHLGVFGNSMRTSTLAFGGLILIFYINIDQYRYIPIGIDLDAFFFLPFFFRWGNVSTERSITIIL